MGLTLVISELNGKKKTPLPIHIFIFPELTLVQEGLLTTVVYRARVC